MTLDECIFWWLAGILFVWFAAFPAHAEFSGYGIDEAAAATAKADDIPRASEFSAGYTAAEIRLLKARVRQLEEKVAKEERTIAAVASRVRKIKRHPCKWWHR